MDMCEHCVGNGDLLGSIRRNTLRMFRHMEKMDDEMLTKRMHESEVENETGKGRMRMMWMEGV